MRSIILFATLISSAAMSNGLFSNGLISTTVPTHKDQPKQVVPRTSGVTDARAAARDGSSDYAELKRQLRASRDRARQLGRYQAVLEQTVTVDGRQYDPEVMQLKFRREPFSVYLIWPSDGKEVLYIEGQNDGKLLARPTRGLAARRGVWQLPPDSAHAMRGQRYPVTELGVEKLANLVLNFHESKQFSDEAVKCTTTNCKFRKLPAVRYEVTFTSPKSGSEFSKSILTFDKKLNILVGVENYGWSSDGTPGELIERYAYHDINLEKPLSEQDFSSDNPQYHFAKR